MKNILTNIMLIITRPKDLFVREKPKLINALVIVLAIGIVNGLSAILNPNISEQLPLRKESKLIFLVLSPLFISLLIMLQTGLRVLLDAVWIKIILKIIHIETNFRTLLSVITFTLVPLLIRDIIILVWPDFRGTLDVGGASNIYFYKTSLAQLVADSNFDNQRILALLAQVELFSIWKYVLEVFAVTIVGKISYKISSSIMLFAWIISTVLFLNFGIR